MALKPTQTALYELMGRKKAPRPQEPAPEAEPPPQQSWRNSAGRTVRLPVGYLWLGGAVAIVLLVAAFSTGYMRGRHEATTMLEREWLATRQPTLAVPPPEVEARRGSAASAGGPGPILSDPRREGVNYFVLIHTHRENAVELARFCRREGVEAYVVPDRRNRSLYRVIALPGYARGQRSSEAVRALEQRIEDVTRKWKLQVNPRDELGYYPERFDG